MLKVTLHECFGFTLINLSLLISDRPYFPLSVICVVAEEVEKEEVEEEEVEEEDEEVVEAEVAARIAHDGTLDRGRDLPDDHAAHTLVAPARERTANHRPRENPTASTAITRGVARTIRRSPKSSTLENSDSSFFFLQLTKPQLPCTLELKCYAPSPEILKTVFAKL